jgi:hypothetical protein
MNKEKPMENLDKQPIDPHRHERRERIATAVLAALVGRAGRYDPDQPETAVRAAEGLIQALDAEGA